MKINQTTMSDKARPRLFNGYCFHNLKIMFIFAPLSVRGDNQCRATDAAMLLRHVRESWCSPL